MFCEQIPYFINVETYFSNNKKIYDLINSILVILGERASAIISSHQVPNTINGNNVHSLDEVINKDYCR